MVCRDDDFRQPLVLRMNDTLPYRWRQLWASTNRYRGASGDRQLRHYSDEEIKALGPNQDQEDIDDGPFKTWKSRYAPCYRDKWALGSYSWVCHAFNFVLWDSERIRRYELDELFSMLHQFDRVF